MPDLRPLSFYGQDSFCSGFFEAKMLMMLAGNEKEVMLMRQHTKTTGSGNQYGSIVIPSHNLKLDEVSKYTDQ